MALSQEIAEVPRYRKQEAAASLLAPIDDGNLGSALDLLRRGFPQRPEAFWLRGIERSRRHMPADARWPLGYLLNIKGRAAGVMLTFASRREALADTSRTVVNLSSWYVEPAARMAAPLMLRKVMTLGDDVLTDLSPSQAVAQMLPPLGFSRWNEGILVMAAPVMMAGRVGEAVVIAADDIPAGSLSDTERQLLADHDALGCICAGLFDGSRCVPLAFAPMRIKGVRAAYLIFAPSRREAIRHRGAIARFLVKRGMPIFCVDADREERLGACMFFSKRQKYYRGGGERDRTDYAYSELVLLGPDEF